MHRRKKKPFNQAIKLIAIIILVFFIGVVTVSAQTQAPQAGKNPTLSAEQRIMGLMTIWSEAKYNFPWFDKLTDLNWDAKVQEYLPKVIAAGDTVAYYRLLMEFAVLLKDGHTSVRAPWFPFLSSEDTIALEVKIIENKVIIVAAGSAEEIKKQGISPGMEILTAEDGIPIMTYFQDKVYRYYTSGSEHANQVWGVFMFFGERGSVLNLGIKDFSGQVRKVSLTRNSLSGKTPFFPQYMLWNAIEKKMEVRQLPEGLLYVRIPSFGIEGIDKQFIELIDTIDPAATKGLIIDLRFNSGGDSQIAEKAAACLIDKTAIFPIMKYPQYIAAYRAWGKKSELLETKSYIQPRQGKRYLGPIVVLTGIGTASTAEDFAVALKYSGRALLVGEKTAGSAGNKLSFSLPGGGSFLVSTFRAYLPDGTEYVHIGVPPDVEVRTSQNDVMKGLDPILDKGLEVIRKWPDYKK